MKKSAAKTNHSLRSRWRSYSLLLITTLCWGSLLVIVKPALSVVTATELLLYRFSLASLLSIPILWYYWPRVKNIWQRVGTVVLLELLGTTLALFLIYEGLDRTSALEANLIATTSPLFTILAGVLILKEKQEKNETLGVGIALVATVLLIVLPGLQQISNQSISLYGNVLVFIHTLVAGVYYVLAKKLYRKIPKFFATAVSFYVGMISFFIINLAQHGWSTAQLVNTTRAHFAYPSVWISTIALAVFGSLIGLTAYIKGQDGIEASEASFFFYLQPLVYIPLGYLLLGESVTPTQLGLLGIILAGVMIAERRQKAGRPL